MESLNAAIRNKPHMFKMMEESRKIIRIATEDI